MQHLNKFGVLVFEKSYPATSKISLEKKAVKILIKNEMNFQKLSDLGLFSDWLKTLGKCSWCVALLNNFKKIRNNEKEYRKLIFTVGYKNVRLCLS